jgi:hypothetical protein
MTLSKKAAVSTFSMAMMTAARQAPTSIGRRAECGAGRHDHERPAAGLHEGICARRLYRVSMSTRAAFRGERAGRPARSGFPMTFTDSLRGLGKRTRLVHPTIRSERSDPACQQKNDNDDQDDAEDTDAAVTVAVTVAAEAATEPAEQGDDEDDDENESQRHELSLTKEHRQLDLGWRFSAESLTGR